MLIHLKSLSKFCGWKKQNKTRETSRWQMYTRWAISQVRKHIHVLSIWICAVYTGGGGCFLYTPQGLHYLEWRRRKIREKSLAMEDFSYPLFLMLNPFVFVMGLFQHSKIYETDAPFFYWRMDVYNADFLAKIVIVSYIVYTKQINVSRDFRSIKKMIFTPRICCWLYTNEHVILMSNFLFCICLFISRIERIADRTRQSA